MGSTKPTFSIRNAFLINALYVKGPRLQDLNVNFINLIVFSYALNASDQKVETFEIHYRGPEAIKNDVYVFLREGVTADDLLAYFEDYQDGDTLTKYTGLLSINKNDQRDTTKDIIVNNRRLITCFVNGDGNTELRLDTDNIKYPLELVVTGDQTDSDNPGSGPADYEVLLSAPEETAANTFKTAYSDNFPDGATLTTLIQMTIDGGSNITVNNTVLSGTPFTSGGVTISYTAGEFSIAVGNTRKVVTLKVSQTFEGVTYVTNIVTVTGHTVTLSNPVEADTNEFETVYDDNFPVGATMTTLIQATFDSGPNVTVPNTVLTGAPFTISGVTISYDSGTKTFTIATGAYVDPVTLQVTQTYNTFAHASNVIGVTGAGA